MRIGFGFDIHRLEPGLPLTLGGVVIEGATHGPVAHSDGDVLLHALCDALLGAAALGDIGHHFPDTDPTLRGISSIELLRRTVEILAANNFTPYNVDSTVVLEAPRIAPSIDSMRKAISTASGIPISHVSVKATTNEQLGSIGRKQGVSAYAIASVNDATLT